MSTDLDHALLCPELALQDKPTSSVYTDLQVGAIFVSSFLSSHEASKSSFLVHTNKVFSSISSRPIVKMLPFCVCPCSWLAFDGASEKQSHCKSVPLGVRVVASAIKLGSFKSAFVGVAWTGFNTTALSVCGVHVVWATSRRLPALKTGSKKWKKFVIAFAQVPAGFGVQAGFTIIQDRQQSVR